MLCCVELNQSGWNVTESAYGRVHGRALGSLSSLGEDDLRDNQEGWGQCMTLSISGFWRVGADV